MHHLHPVEALYEYYGHRHGTVPVPQHGMTLLDIMVLQRCVDARAIYPDTIALYGPDADVSGLLYTPNYTITLPDILKTLTAPCLRDPAVVRNQVPVILVPAVHQGFDCAKWCRHAHGPLVHHRLTQIETMKEVRVNGELVSAREYLLRLQALYYDLETILRAQAMTVS